MRSCKKSTCVVVTSNLRKNSVGSVHTGNCYINLFATSEPPKYLNSNSPNLCFDFFNESATNNLRQILY